MKDKELYIHSITLSRAEANGISGSAAQSIKNSCVRMVKASVLVAASQVELLH